MPAGAFRADVERMLWPWLEREAQASCLARLPSLVCEAAGGDARQAAPATAAWQLVRLAAKLLDDVEDGDVATGCGAMVNVATGLLFGASLILKRLGVPTDRSQSVRDELQLAMLHAASGQHADLLAQTADATALDPDGWFAIARAKSGELVGWAAWAGAYAAAVPPPALEAYREYGICLGVLLQVVDDFNGIWRSDGKSDLAEDARSADLGDGARPADLAAGVTSLPVCYARLVARGRVGGDLERVLQAASEGDTDAEREGLELLTELGAQGFMVVVAEAQRREAREALARAGCRPPARDRLLGLLDEVLASDAASEEAPPQRAERAQRKDM
ncbi:MAG: polyprenyl synthetase family protein [Chloroflexi bacterium]|nr:polyprenyl synthetase family protein [Chloroflexota bacterium]